MGKAENLNNLLGPQSDKRSLVVLYKKQITDEDLQCTAGKGFKIYGLIINYG
jgi:hypothetical protein